MPRGFRKELGEYINTLTKRDGITSRHIADIFKVETRNANLALEGMMLKGNLTRKLMSIPTERFGSKSMWVYYKK